MTSAAIAWFTTELQLVLHSNISPFNNKENNKIKILISRFYIRYSGGHEAKGFSMVDTTANFEAAGFIMVGNNFIGCALFG